MTEQLAHVKRYSSLYNAMSSKVNEAFYRHNLGNVIKVMEDKVDFFSPTQLQALEFVLLK